MQKSIRYIRRFTAKNEKKLRLSWPLLGLLGVVILYNILVPRSTWSQYIDLPQGPAESWTVAVEPPSLPTIEPFEDRVIRNYRSQVTVYHSVPWQTSGDPFITASGTRVHDGTVAANCLPFGTRLRLPEISGDKVYVVEDRLAADKSCFIIDIWEDYTLNPPSFGAPITTIEILDGSPRQTFAWL